MKWFVQILNTQTSNGTVPGLMVHFEKSRYLINCGEGTQRLSSENSVKIGKINTIFVSGNGWDHTGGLPGMLLTMSSVGVNSLSVCGPKNTAGTLYSTRIFTQMSKSSFKTTEWNETNRFFKNEDLHVIPIKVYQGESKDCEQKSGANENSKSTKIENTLDSSGYSDIKTTGENLKRRRADSIPESNVIPNDDVNSRSIDIEKKNHFTSYIIAGPQPPGKFDIKKAKALGLKPGPSFKELVSGKSIVTPDGVTIFPDQVVEKPKPRGVFIYIDCPSSGYINSIVKNSQFEQFYEKSKDADYSMDIDGTPDNQNSLVDFDLKFIVHFVGSDVLLNENYVEWMKRFPKSVKHVICGEEYCGDINPFVRHSKLQMKLGQVDSKIFVRPMNHMVPEKKLPNGLTDLDTVTGEFNLRLEVEPKFKINRGYVNKYVEDDVMTKTWLNEAKKDTKLFNSLNSRKNEFIKESTTIQNYDCETAKEPQNEYIGKDFLVSTMGTGSAIPSCKRNVSSNLLYIPGYGYALLDCGEGTVSQIKRLLGTKTRRNIWNNRIPGTYETFLNDLKLVYISHLHADHHLGLILLLEDWKRMCTENQTREDTSNQVLDSSENRKTLFIICPNRYIFFLKELSHSLDIGFDSLVIIPSTSFLLPSQDNNLIPPKPQQNGNDNNTSEQMEKRNVANLGNLNSQYPETQRRAFNQQQKEIVIEKEKQMLYESLGLDSIVTCEVDHYGSCYGVSISHKKKWQLIYSGDTRPCLNMIKLASYKMTNHNQPLNLLIHEATLYDELYEDAVSKKHSTVSEAIAISLAMRAQHTIFTHFSQRYVGIPKWTLHSVHKAYINGCGRITKFIEDPSLALTKKGNNLSNNQLIQAGRNHDGTKSDGNESDNGSSNIKKFQNLLPTLDILFNEEKNIDLLIEQTENESE
ncbi:hypothetical protein BB559_005475 [Furculomyces boomerangus]|uniref:ribonuclease Z n=1 Tax=Furculomyces boomerangus TaxID=61424 RepID=A0A2T9Y8L3_9FUNG|nr:hypothetical protein BB559_005475 [Furculomyces boomerangus]